MVLRKQSAADISLEMNKPRFVIRVDPVEFLRRIHVWYPYAFGSSDVGRRTWTAVPMQTRTCPICPSCPIRQFMTCWLSG